MASTDYCFETLCVKGDPAYVPYDKTGAISLPIYQTATFAHPALGQSTGFDYSRLANPTRQFLEKTVAALDNAKYGFAFSCGMAAVTALFDTFPSGSHIISSDDIYGGNDRLFRSLCVKQGLKTTFVPGSNLADFEEALTPETKIIFIETPGNPMMTILDIPALSELAHKNGAILVVDNTFLTAYYQKPLDLGADVVVQSGTKYLCGHNDTLAGFVTTNNEKIADDLALITKTTGAVLSPFDSWLALRGIKTLPLRLERQTENARKIAEYLASESRVSRVLYPKIGGMISFYVDSKATVEKILKSIRVIHFAESLGGVESLITYPLTQTHSELPEETREVKGITETLLRMSVGIENVNDLIADLRQAFNA